MQAVFNDIVQRDTLVRGVQLTLGKALGLTADIHGCLCRTGYIMDIDMDSLGKG